VKSIRRRFPIDLRIDGNSDASFFRNLDRSLPWSTPKQATDAQTGIRGQLFEGVLDAMIVATNTVATGFMKGGMALADRGLGEEIKKRNAFDSAEQEVALNLTRTVDQFHCDFARLFKNFGITGSQYNVLRILRGEGRALPCQEISGRLITQVPDVTRLVDRLEEAGLVQRSRTPDDRRVVLTDVTPCGMALLDKLDAPVLELHRKHLGHLSPEELAELNRLLVKARAGRSAVNSGCCPPGDSSGCS
jgi:DNA-binding MarR family transcriptional regulator